MSEMSEKYSKSLYAIHPIERSEDFILPDSFPDVKNVISCKARLGEVKTYFGPVESEATLCVIYNILFSSVNAHGSTILCSVNFKDEIKESIRYKYDGNVGVCIKNEVAQASCRMANPRKFTIKTLIKAYIFETVEERIYPDIQCQLPSDANMQYLLEEVEAMSSASVILGEHSFSDNVELDTRSPEIKELVHWNAELIVNEDKRNDSDMPLKLKGIFGISCVYLDNDAKYRVFKREIPFGITLNDDEKAMLLGKGEYSFIYPTANISAMNLNIGKNQYGENKVLEFDADYDIDILMLGNKKVSVVKDAYSTVYSCDINTVRTRFSYIDGICKTNLTCSEVNEYPSVKDICACLDAQYAIDGIELTNGDKISGKLRNKVAVISDDGLIATREITSPFSCKTENLNGSNIVGGIEALPAKTRCDGEKIYTDSELYLNLLSLRESDVPVSGAISGFTPESKASESIFSIFYQPSDETLWNTAKLKKTTVDRILKSNPDIDTRYSSAIIIE